MNAGLLAGLLWGLLVGAILMHEAHVYAGRRAAVQAMEEVGAALVGANAEWLDGAAAVRAMASDRWEDRYAAETPDGRWLVIAGGTGVMAPTREDAEEALQAHRAEEADAALLRQIEGTANRERAS